jgi:hypothetical protein
MLLIGCQLLLSDTSADQPGMRSCAQIRAQAMIWLLANSAVAGAGP